MMAFELPERHRTNVARWRRRVAGALVVSLVVMTTSPTALAADRTTHATLLQVNVADAAIVELPSNSKSKLLDVNEFEMRKAETVTIDIVDNNPLLFTYEAEVAETETEQHKTAAEFAKVLAALMSGFKSGGGADGAILVEGLNFSALRGRLQALSMSMNGIGPQISKSLGTPADIESMKGTVRSWNISGLTSGLVDDLQKVAVIAGKCLAGSTLTTNTDITLTCTSALEDAEQPPDTLRKLRELREQSQKEAAARAAEQQKLAAAKKPTTSGKPAAPAPQNAPQAPISGGPPPAPGGPGAPGAPAASPVAAGSAASSPSGAPTPAAIPGERIVDFVTLIEARRTDLQNSISVLRGFASDVEDVGKAKTLATRTHSTKTQTVNITVKSSTKYDAFLDAATKKRRDAIARKFAIVLQPYTPAAISLGPALILLFIQNPTFKAAKKGDQFVIQESDDEVTAYNLAAMLNITPRGWSEPTFGGGFQIGVSPTKDKIGFYMGAGISVQELFWFGGGFTWQEVNKLAGGLTSGQIIASPDELKTTTHFKPGFYFHVTANIK